MKKPYDDLTRAMYLSSMGLHEAQKKKRAAGEPRNPTRARPGMEEQFEEAAKDARAYRFIREVLTGERAAALFKRKNLALTERAAAFFDRALDFLIALGLVLLSALGVAAAFVVLRLPGPAAKVAAIGGVALALFRAVRDARK